MAKKILGDDPFRTTSEPGESPAPSKAAKANRAKRAPSRKLEAPRAVRSPKVTAEKVAVTRAPVAEVPVVATQALAPITEPAASDVAVPGTWRWWRSRQLQLARAETSVFMTRTGGPADRFGRDPMLAGRAEPILDFLYRSWLRVTVRGLGHVPDSGRAILVAKRRTSQRGLFAAASAGLAKIGWRTPPAVDAAVIAHAVRIEHVSHREVRPLVRQKRLYAPLFGSLLRRLGGVPSELHDFARLLDDDQIALAFVDNHDGEREGAIDTSTLVSLAMVTGAPIVPVTVDAVFANDGRFTLRPANKTLITFGTPIFPGAEYGSEGAEDDQLVARLAGELSAQL